MAAALSPHPDASAFLAAHGHSDAVIRPLAGDASFRRYFRVATPEETFILMDAPPADEDSRPFISVAAHLVERGFRAPGVLAVDLDRGLVLLEDLGEARMAEVVADDPGREEPIYAAAIDLLVALQADPPPATLAPYDRAVLQREAGLLIDWYAPALELSVDGGAYASAWDAVLGPVLATKPAVLVLRDYHAENVMLLPDGTLGLLDFQDALAGHPAYDLVSLLQDARRDVSPELEAAMLARYDGQRPLDRGAYAILGAQRNAKILGIFTRLWKRDGKPRYLSYQPRVWRYLQRDLEHPALAPVAAWFDANIPQSARAAAWVTVAA